MSNKECKTQSTPNALMNRTSKYSLTIVVPVFN